MSNPNSDIEKKEIKTSKFVNLLKNGEIKFITTSTSFSWSKVEVSQLLQFRNLVQKQLPKMPKEYIFRILFSDVHRCLLCYQESDLVGGLCYRPFYEQFFAEIVFLAINSDFQIKGFGSFLVDFFKEHFKTEVSRYFKADKKSRFTNEILSIYNPEFSVINEHNDYISPKYKHLSHPIYIMTYADCYAIGFFKKQGFTSDITFKNWIRYIKDYEGGSLMQCKVYWKINYLLKMEFIEHGRQIIVNKISKVSQFNILRSPEKVDNIFDVPGFKEAQLKEEMLLLKNPDTYLKNIFSFITSDLKSDSHAWPFLEPVNKDLVCDYYSIIKEPMDLKTLSENIQNGKYQSWREYESDVLKIFQNCRIYNRPNTQYCKCADALEKRFKLKAEQVVKALKLKGEFII
ncbi:Histone acetyltransferase GCN5 [Dictyocoela muelleri]|nr:Histone acetyltransferase GCN5 [Dictyocoela muelleri]